MGVGNRALVIVLSIASISEAFKEVGKVDSIVSSRKVANLAMDYTIDESATSLFLGTKDKNCEGLIIKREQNIFTIDISKCDVVDLKTGASVFYMAEYAAPAPPEPQKPEVAQVIEERDNSFKFGVGFRINNRLRFTEAKLISGTSLATGTLEYTSSGNPVLLDWGFSSTKKNSWGWGAGLTYTVLHWDTVTASGVTGSTTLTAMGTTTVVSPYANIIYRWENVFVPMGFNLSSFSHEGTPYFVTQNKGTLGAQLGLGVVVNKNFSFLVESKVFGFGGAAVTSGNTTLDADLGFSSGLNFMGLFGF